MTVRAPPSSPIEALRFGSIEVRAAERRVLVDARPAALGARAFDLLMALVQQRHRVVSKDELLDTVWPGLVVEENNLSVHVSALRKALGAQAIATIPGRGYRFTAADGREATAADTAAGATAAHSASPAPPRRTQGAVPPDALIGREADLVSLGALVDAYRLVTVCGAGGVGKTRVCERLLHERREAFAHGVAWVDLSGVTEPAWVVPTIAAAIGVTPRAGADPVASLASVLAPLQMLVALDNAEQVADEVARVVQALLDEAGDVRLIVTSQVPLRLAREHVYALGGLSVPPGETSAPEALAHGAVALFVERARAADRRFIAEPHLLPAIVRICRRLDGVALAIELAAARVALLGIDKLDAALDERLELLTQGHRHAPSRQRTLRAALQWSHALLDETEQIVFRRLGVFNGGFTLDTAREVAAGRDRDVLEPWTAVDALGALVDRSLVAVEGGDDPRYRLLESARAFALECLEASGESTAIRGSHAAAVRRRFVEVDAACLAGKVSVDEAVRMLAPDWDNAREALVWMVEHGEREGAAELALALNAALTMARQRDRAWVWETTARCADDDAPARVRALWSLGWSGFSYVRQPAAACAQALVAVAHFRAAGPLLNHYRSLGVLAYAAAQAGNPAQCREAVEEMFGLETPDWPPRLRFYRAGAEWNLNLIAGDEEAVHAVLERMHELAVAAGDSSNEHNMLVALADSELALGRVDEAVRIGVELERRLAGSPHQAALAYARMNLTGALVLQRSVAAARAMAESAWPLVRRFALVHTLSDSLSMLALLEQRPRDTARLLGFGDARYAAAGARRDRNEARTVEAAGRGAREALGEAEFERLHAEGAGLGEDELLVVALGPRT
jgi:predicted ATPase/DNA-binding winged helix-turn-helix (wHTH) protein